MSEQLIRCESPAQVVGIAQANHVPYSHTAYAASVTLPGSVTYWWAAA